MTTYRCIDCGNHWQEGTGVDMVFSETCWRCLREQLEELQDDPNQTTEEMASLRLAIDEVRAILRGDAVRPSTSPGPDHDSGSLDPE